MNGTVNLSLRCRHPRELPEGRFNPQWRHIPAKISSPAVRTPFLFLAELFKLLAGPSARLETFEGKADYMGGLEVRMELASDTAKLSFDYEQGIDDEWQHVERNRFSPCFETAGPVGLSYDLDMAGPGQVEFTLYNAGPELVENAITLADECFGETVLGPRLADDLRIKATLAQAGKERRRKTAGPSSPDRPPRDGIELLEAALDRERDAYMEWHDGPDYSPETEAVNRLAETELVRAGEMIKARLEAGYDVHLGRAAVLLGRRGAEQPRMVTALETALRSEKQSYLRARIARDILRLYSSVPAQIALRQAIECGAGWSEKVDAICCLKELAEERKNDRPLQELLPPETAETLLQAMAAEDYLVRYHAADTLLRAMDEVNGIASKKELFGLVCGKNRETKAGPDQEDRKGFERAKQELRSRLAGKGIV